MRFKKRSRRQPKWSEDARMHLAVFCTIAVIAGLFAIAVWLTPAESRARPPNSSSYGTAR